MLFFWFFKNCELIRNSSLWRSNFIPLVRVLIINVGSGIQVLKRINDNAYKLDLPDEYNISATFNVSDLSPFDVCDDSRTNPFEERGNDENQQAFKDPLHVPIGPITKARSKNIKKALNGLIQEIWANSNAGHSKLGPKEDEGVINLIQTIEG